MLGKTIPVIGVPTEPSQLPNTSLVNSKIILSPTKPQAPVPKVKNAPKEDATKDQVPKPTKKLNKLNNIIKNLAIPKNLITSTGLPPSQNGDYAKEAEEKLSTVEKTLMQAYIDKNRMELKSKDLTEKQTKKHLFQSKLIWLLNKKTMLEQHEKIQKTKKLATEAKSKAKREKAQEKKAAKPTALMDLVVAQPAELRKTTNYDDSDKRASSSYASSSNPTGYQYLKDDWFNADKPWRNFQTSSSITPSTDFTSSYSSSITMNPFPSLMSSSTPSYGIPTSNSFPLSTPPSSLNYPMMTDSSFPKQLSSSSSYSPLQPNSVSMPFTAPPPSFGQASFSQTFPPVSTDPAPTEAISLYRQQFPIQEQPLPSMTSSTDLNYFNTNPVPQQQLKMEPYQNLQPPEQHSQSPFPAAVPLEFPTMGNLEMSEEELARQRRLIEIEQELQLINFKKMQMQMENELREREMEFAYRQQMMEYREREIRDREMMQERRRSSDRDREPSSRHRYDDYGYSSSHPDDCSYSHHQDSSRSSDNHRQQYRNSSYSNSRQINIERADDGARRHGRNEKQRGEGSLKRSAETSNRQDNNQSGRIQPAKKPRHRHLKPAIAHENFQMQEISDED